MQFSAQSLGENVKIIEPKHISRLKREEIPPIHIPETFRRQSNIELRMRYGISDSVSLSGISSFENAPVTITLSPMEGRIPAFSLNNEPFSLIPENCIKGSHNIQLGPIKIIEHPMSLMTALHLDFDLNITQESFPTFNTCNLPYWDALKPCLVQTGPLKYFTPKQTFSVQFTKGYCILEPMQNEKTLIVDHQVQYPGSSLGNLRVLQSITPDFYLALCSARTPSFQSREETKKNLEILRTQTIDYPMGLENVLFVDEDQIHNPRKEFDIDGTNIEFMMHEIIDIIAWIKFLEIQHDGAFVGKMTTYRFDHHSQIDMALLCKDNLEIEFI